MINRKVLSGMLGIMAMLGISFSLNAQDTLTTWQYSTAITLNTSATGANTSSTQYNFPVLIRLTSLNAAAVFATARSDGGDLRFTRTGVGDTSQLPYELNKYNQAAQTALIWVKVDSLVGNNANQTINMYWGKSTAVTTSDSTKVFSSANGFAAVLHLNKLSTGTTLYDATGQGNNGTPSGTVTDTTGVFDRAVAMHCYGTSSSYVAGDSITIAGLLGSPSQVTLSAWVRVDSIDQANTSANGHLSCIMSMGDYASLNDAGATGTGNDSITAAWFGSGTQWNNYGWPSPSQTGTSLNGFSNTSGQAALHQGWRHLALVINPTARIANVYMNGDSVKTLPAANALAWTGGNSGKRTVIGKHGGGHSGLKFGGSICESRFEGVPRASDWIRLCYQNQQPNDSLTAINAVAPAVPVLAQPTNGASGVSVTLSLRWSAAAGANSYGVQVSTTTSFATTSFQQSGITATSASPTGLANGTTYYWRANASSSVGTSAWSGVWSFMTISPVGAPTLIAPVNGAGNQALAPVLSWNAVNTAISYSVLASTASDFSTTTASFSGVTGTSQSLSGLAASKTYYWEVNAKTSSSTSVWSSVWSFTTSAIAGTPALASPTNGAANQLTSLTFSWGTASAATSYTIQVSAGSGFTTTIVSQSVAGTSAAVSGLAPNATYYWEVAGANAAGSGSWSTTWSFTTAAVAGIPVLASPSNGAVNQKPSLTFSWGTSSAAASYMIQVSAGSAFTTTVVSQGVSGTSLAVSGLTLGATYYWHVAGVNVAGQGTWSSVWVFTVTSVGVLANGGTAMLKTDFGVRGDALLYSVASSGAVEITFNDLLGRVALAVNRTMAAGSYTLSLRNLSLAPGSYIVRFKAGGIEKIRTVMLER